MGSLNTTPFCSFLRGSWDRDLRGQLSRLLGKAGSAICRGSRAKWCLMVIIPIIGGSWWLLETPWGGKMRASPVSWRVGFTRKGGGPHWVSRIARLHVLYIHALRDCLPRFVLRDGRASGRPPPPLLLMFTILEDNAQFSTVQQDIEFPFFGMTVVKVKYKLLLYIYFFDFQKVLSLTVATVIPIIGKFVLCVILCIIICRRLQPQPIHECAFSCFY